MLYNPQHDTPQKTKIKTPRKPSLLYPSLQGLSYLLRHQELWPPKFSWCYASCTQCAMGLANQKWGIGCYTVAMSKALRIHADTAVDLFLSYQESPITPNVIADRIDRYLKDGSHAV